MFCLPCCFTVYSIIDRLPSIPRICVFLKRGLGKPRAGNKASLYIATAAH